MVICKRTANAYYPMSSKRLDLIRGGGRIRYFRGFLLISSKNGGAVADSRSATELRAKS